MRIFRGYCETPMARCRPTESALTRRRHNKLKTEAWRTSEQDVGETSQSLLLSQWIAQHHFRERGDPAS